MSPNQGLWHIEPFHSHMMTPWLIMPCTYISDHRHPTYLLQLPSSPHPKQKYIYTIVQLSEAGESEAPAGAAPCKLSTKKLVAILLPRGGLLPHVSAYMCHHRHIVYSITVCAWWLRAVYVNVGLRLADCDLIAKEDALPSSQTHVWAMLKPLVKLQVGSCYCCSAYLTSKHAQTLFDHPRNKPVPRLDCAHASVECFLAWYATTSYIVILELHSNHSRQVWDRLVSCHLSISFTYIVKIDSWWGKAFFFIYFLVFILRVLLLGDFVHQVVKTLAK